MDRAINQVVYPRSLLERVNAERKIRTTAGTPNGVGKIIKALVRNDYRNENLGKLMPLFISSLTVSTCRMWLKDDSIKRFHELLSRLGDSCLKCDSDWALTVRDILLATREVHHQELCTHGFIPACAGSLLNLFWNPQSMCSITMTFLVVGLLAPWSAAFGLAYTTTRPQASLAKVFILGGACLLAFITVIAVWFNIRDIELFKQRVELKALKYCFQMHLQDNNDLLSLSSMWTSAEKYLNLTAPQEISPRTPRRLILFDKTRFVITSVDKAFFAMKKCVLIVRLILAIGTAIDGSCAGAATTFTLVSYYRYQLGEEADLLTVVAMFYFPILFLWRALMNGRLKTLDTKCTQMEMSLEAILASCHSGGLIHYNSIHDLNILARDSIYRVAYCRFFCGC